MPSLEHAMLFCHELVKESKEIRNNIIVCPSTIHLYPLMHHFKEYTLQLGAQNCSEHERGAYTGETAASSVARDWEFNIVLSGTVNAACIIMKRII